MSKPISAFLPRAAAYVLLAALAGASLLQGQGSPPAAAKPAGAGRVWMGPDGQPLPFKNDEEVLEFLRTAKMLSMKNLPRGISQPSVLMLEKNGVKSRAHFNEVDQQKDIVTLASGKREFAFRDTYKFNGAAYELSRMLGLDNVPPAVERRMKGRPGSVSMWIENAMTERDRISRNIRPPEGLRWNRQVQNMRVFDNLIYNTDRTQENILIGPDWKLWMIDHTRAFRRWDDLNNPDGIVIVERKVWEKLQTLDEAAMRQRLRPYLTTFEIDGLLKRRVKLVAYIQKLIAERGEAAVLFTME